MSNANVLSQRYAGPEINGIFSETGRILAERDLWIAVMKAQKKLGIAIPADVIEGYEAARDHIDLDFMKQREIETKHDVKAKIEGFVKASGKDEHIHKGMTSRDPDGQCGADAVQEGLQDHPGPLCVRPQAYAGVCP